MIYIKIIKLPNVGIDTHTYLYHIINNYETLAPITIFCHGSAPADNNKCPMLEYVTEQVLKTDDTVMIGSTYDQPVRDELYNFCIDWYDTTNKVNFSKIGKCTVVPHNLRPFGVRYDSMFSKEAPVNTACLCTQFAISAADIRSRPKHYYEELMKYVDSAPSMEFCHFMERAWVAVIRPRPACVHNWTYDNKIETYSRSRRFVIKSFVPGKLTFC